MYCSQPKIKAPKHGSCIKRWRFEYKWKCLNTRQMPQTARLALYDLKGSFKNSDSKDMTLTHRVLVHFVLELCPYVLYGGTLKVIALHNITLTYLIMWLIIECEENLLFWLFKHRYITQIYSLLFSINKRPKVMKNVAWNRLNCKMDMRGTRGPRTT